MHGKTSDMKAHHFQAFNQTKKKNKKFIHIHTKKYNALHIESIFN